MSRRFSVLAASFVVATGLFGAWMLASPPVSEAATKPGIEVSQVRGTGIDRRRILDVDLALAVSA